MNNYNVTIVPKIVEYIKGILERIEASYTEGASIQLTKWESIDSNNLDVNYLMINGLTGSFTLRLYFDIKLGDDDPVSTYDDLEIPKIINNVFVIDGSIRIPTNSLENDDAITVYYSNIRINDLINFTFEEDSHYDDGYKVVLYIYDDEEPTVIDFTKDAEESYKSYLKLRDFEIDKLKVKLDTNNIPEYLTRDLIIKLINLGPDKDHDNLVDKKVYSPESKLIKYLNDRKNRQLILRGMRSKFNNYQKIFIRDIQNAINRYFKIADEKGIDIPTTVNPLIFDALKYKVEISKNVAYNETMSDIIDIVNTPINSNVNRINELNVCAEIKDDVIYIKCYTYPDQSPITVPYSHYCTKKVLLNQYWDYDLKKFINKSSIVKYKLRNKIYESNSTDSFDYIEPKPDDKLSITTRRIPLANMSDFGRLAMGTSMSKQALELSNSEPSLVTAGHDDDDYVMSTLITRYSGTNPCTVTLIKDNKIFLKDKKDGSITFIEIPSPTIGQNDSLISFNSKVKVGDEISNGDILVLPQMLTRKSYELGVNTNVIYMNYLGYTHEDGIVISQSYSKKLRHYTIQNVILELRPDDIIKYIIPIGSKVKSKDVLVNNQTRLRVSQSVKDAFTSEGGLLQGLGIQYNQNNLIVPNNTDEGYVLDVKIHIEQGRDLTSEYSNKIISDYLSSDKSHDYDNVIPDKFKNEKADPIFELKDRLSGYISVKLMIIKDAIIGSKLTNRYGSKGVVSLVLPDNCMPRICKSSNDPNGIPADMILNPAAVVSRKNISQLYEAAIGKCVKLIYEIIVNKVNSKSDYSEIRKFLEVFYGNKFNSIEYDEFMSKLQKHGIYMFRMDVGCYSKITYNQVLGWMEYLGIDDTDYIYCPDVVICETNNGTKGYPLDTYNQAPDHANIKKYELGWCESKSITGNEYIMKLFHSADYSAKVTAAIMDTDSPVMGRGNWKGSGQGQRIGEMEMWVLLQTSNESFLTSQSPDMMTNQYVFLNELILAGYTVMDDEGNPLLSNYGQKLAKLRELGSK